MSALIRMSSPGTRARYVLAALPALGAIALLLSSLNLWWGYGDARRSLYISQASVVVGRLDEAVATQLLVEGSADATAALHHVLESIDPVGGTGFAVFRLEGDLAASSELLLSGLVPDLTEQLRVEPDGSVVYVTSRHRQFQGVGHDQYLLNNSDAAARNAPVAEPTEGFVGQLPPPLHHPGARPPRFGRPPPPHEQGSGPGAGPLRRGPPPPLPVAVRFRPVTEESMGWRFRVALAINGIGGVLLLLASLWVFRELGRRDRLMAELSSKRHLSSLGVMSATLAHEIRNPLASIKGHAQLLRETSTPASPHWNKSDRIVEESVRLEHLVNSLLEFVRSGTSNQKFVPVESVCRRGIGQVGPERSRVSLDLSLAPESWCMDSTQIERVLHNLVDNALLASDTSEVRVRVWQESSRLWVSVRDDGPGIPAALLDTLFEPFVTGRLHGTGLGLSICRQLVAAHGGEIQAMNPSDGGAEFRFWLAAGNAPHGKDSHR